MIDAGFKTFCTPLRLPFPLEISAGARITQSVELRLRDTRAAKLPAAARITSAPDGVLLTRTENQYALPPIGFTRTERPLSTREIERLATPKPGHLRLDLRLAESPAAETFARAANESGRLQAPLEVALFLGDNTETELQSLTSLLQQQRPRIARWLVFDADAKSSSAQSLRLARQVLQSCDAPIGGGTCASVENGNPCCW